MESWLRGHHKKLEHFNPKRGDVAQHAIPETYEQWGPFDFEFTVVRNPLRRFFSMLGFWLHRDPPKLGLHRKPHDPNALAIKAIKAYEEDPSAWHNHVRPQVDFVTDRTQVYRTEANYSGKIAHRLGLALPFPRTNRSKVVVHDKMISTAVIRKVQDLYAQDYMEFGYAR